MRLGIWNPSRQVAARWWLLFALVLLCTQCFADEPFELEYWDGPTLAAPPFDEFCETPWDLPPGALLYPPWPTRGRIIGIRDDPLSAYSDVIGYAFPNGIPLNEVPFALDVLRAHKAQQLLNPVPLSVGPPISFPPVVEPVSPAPLEVEPSPPVETQPEQVLPQQPGVPPLPAPPAESPDAEIDALHLEAFPLASQGNSDWDVLVLDLQAVDRFGRPAVLSGTLQATLFGQEQRFVLSRGEQFISQTGRIEQLGTWTRQIDAIAPTTDVDHAEEGLVRVRLPLSRPLPEHDFTVAPWGEITVTVTVPGQGVYAASVGDVPLRKSTRLREQNLLETGSQFFDREPTRDNRNVTNLRPQLRSTLRPNSRIFSIKP
jgi:hypothetical protein